jgi:hypothetical protein
MLLYGLTTRAGDERPPSMTAAVVAPVRAIAQAHAAFSRAAVGAVLFADAGIEGEGGDRRDDKTE